MISNLKRKGTRKEEMIVSELKKEGYDIAQRSAGSNSPIDIFAISIKNKTIKLIQSKRVMNQSIDRVMRGGAKGVRIVISGRIGGAEIARREWKAAGTMPLHTLRADIDFSVYPALTKSGYVGVKVWINKGEAKI